MKTMIRILFSSTFSIEQMAEVKYTPVILCGGSGSRLYPLSRDNKPKQFLRLINDLSLLQNTILRFSSAEEIYLVSNLKHEDILFFQLKELRDKRLIGPEVKINVILEPFSMNTAPPVGFVCNLLRGRNLLFLPCDHVYDDALLLGAVNSANVSTAAITTIGKVPTAPETGFGYLLYDDTTSRVIKFIEKPSREVAEGYLASKKYYWNSGIFLMKSDEVKVLLETHLEKTMEVIAALDVKKKIHLGMHVLTLGPTYEKCDNISIDHGLMEKMVAGSIGMIKYAGRWNDIGSFSSVHAVLEEEKGVRTKTLEERAENCYVNAGKLVLLCHVKDLVVVDTPDVLFVGDLEHSQDVKKLYERVKREGLKEIQHSNIAYFPWGVREILCEEKFRISKITVYPLCKFSVEEESAVKHWNVLEGSCSVTNGAAVVDMKGGDYVTIKPSMRHGVVNEGDSNLVLLENSTKIG